MTNVYAERDGDSYLISIQGHATGSEQVCAAVSSIAYMLAGYLINAEAAKKLTANIHDLTDASVVVRFVGGVEANTIYNAVVIGLKQIANSYNDYIKIVEVEI